MRLRCHRNPIETRDRVNSIVAVRLHSALYLIETRRKCMFTFKSKAAAITAGVVAFLGIQAYGFYSTRRSFEARLNQMENELESLRAAESARMLQIGSNPQRVSAAKAAEQKPSGNPKNKGAVITVGDRIDRNPRLASKLQKMLPPGVSLKQSASGFKNERRFISTVHVSNNLRIPFTQLKAKITGKRAVSMEAAIHELRPGLSKARAKAEVEKGERQARETEKLGRTA